MMNDGINEFEIQPYVGAGPFKLGSSREKTRQVVNAKFKVSKKKSSAGNTSDYYTELVAFAFYDNSDLLEAVEFIRPANPTYLDEAFFRKNFEQNRIYILKVDPSADVEPDMVTSKKLGIAIWSEKSHEDKKAQIDTVLVFRRGYYD